MAHLQSAAPLSVSLPSPEQDAGEWPFDALREFAIRMAAQGESVSTRMMAGNRLYAVEQLARAHALGDPGLSELALALFRHFERQRSGVTYVG